MENAGLSLAIELKGQCFLPGGGSAASKTSSCWAAPRFGDDLPVRADTLRVRRSCAASRQCRNPVRGVAGALAVPGVDCVVTSEDARRWSRPFAIAVKRAMEHWCLAMDGVPYQESPSSVTPLEAKGVAAGMQ